MLPQVVDPVNRYAPSKLGITDGNGANEDTHARRLTTPKPISHNPQANLPQGTPIRPSPHQTPPALPAPKSPTPAMGYNPARCVLEG